MKMRLIFAVFLAIFLSGCGSSDSSNSNSHPAYLTIPQANHVIGYRIANDTGKPLHHVRISLRHGSLPSAVSVAPSHSFVYVTDSVDNDVVAVFGRWQQRIADRDFSSDARRNISSGCSERSIRGFPVRRQPGL